MKPLYSSRTHQGRRGWRRTWPLQEEQDSRQEVEEGSRQLLSRPHKHHQPLKLHENGMEHLQCCLEDAIMLTKERRSSGCCCCGHGDCNGLLNAHGVDGVSNLRGLGLLGAGTHHNNAAPAGSKCRASRGNSLAGQECGSHCDRVGARRARDMCRVVSVAERQGAWLPLLVQQAGFILPGMRQATTQSNPSEVWSPATRLQ